MKTWDVEYTDTFGGEANYSWVRRASIDVPDGATDRLIMKRARDALGIYPAGRWTNYGDQFEFHPSNCCTVLFVTLHAQ